MRSPFNESGRPLAGADWLEAHHRAKLAERQAFAHRLAELAPASVLDVGCGTGLWLQELHQVLPPRCRLIGIDSDAGAVAAARARAASWPREVEFLHREVHALGAGLPASDLTLLFNVSGYLDDSTLDGLLRGCAERGGRIAVRQYDGSSLRFGPMDGAMRNTIDGSLYAAVAHSGDFRHYDMDRLVEALHRAPFKRREIGFELFSRSAPFPDEFVDYLDGTIAWTREYISDDARLMLDDWWAPRQSGLVTSTYFTEVDLVAVLS